MRKLRPCHENPIPVFFQTMKACGAVAAAVFLVATATSRAEDGLRVGSASCELAADDSMVIGGGIGPGAARGQEGKLRAVATVMELPGESPEKPPRRAAIIACDILMIARDYLDHAAGMIEEELGIPFDSILINATHTHHAPTTVTIHGYERDEAFCERVRDAIVCAARKASERLGDGSSSRARLHFRLGEESSVGQNSRLLLGDGTIFWIGPREDEVRPTGPFDPDLPVLAFRRASSGYESVIFGHSTHLIGCREAGKRSPGFYALAAQDLEPELGGTVTFISGASGSTHNLELRCDEMERRVRAAVLDAMEKASGAAVTELRGLRREVTYRVRNFDEEAEDAAVIAYTRKRCEPGGAERIAEVFRSMRRQLASHRGEERRTWVQALRIGDIAWVGIPGECFTRIGIEIKRRSPFRYTFIAGLANDYIGYIPDEPAYALGGYQVWTGLHSMVEKGTGERLADTAVELLETLRGERSF